jgi:uncharacterized protein YggE
VEKPDTITVVVSHREEIRADKADIYLTAKAASLVTGDAALKKAKEVAQVVTQLTAAGVDRDHIALRGVQGDRNTPIIGPFNPANYLIRVHCPELERLPDLLAIITAQRNVILDQLIWRFPDDEAVQARWLEACLASAREKAGRIAASLGVKLLGVHSLRETWTDPGDDQKRVLFNSTRAALAKAGGERGTEISFPLVTTKQIEVQVEVVFRVSAYE